MVRVGLIGVGNVASALVQAIELAKNGREIYGILDLPIKPSELDIVVAFDIDKRKVNKKLREAIFSKPNVVDKYVDVKNDIMVLRGPTFDGNSGILSNIIEESEDKPVDIEDVLKEEKVEVMVNLLPTGAINASNFYALASLNVGTSFVNATPTPIAKEMGYKFAEKRIPVLGDDLLSQIGGTITHTGIIEFLKSRGVKILRSYQVDIAGSTEALVTLEEWRKDVKKGIKSSYISQYSNGAEVVAGTSDYVEFLKDRRVSYMVIEGIYGIGIPVRIDISLKTYDSINAVSPLIDLIRIAKILLSKGIGGAVKEVCGYYFKSPPRHYNSLVETKSELEKFLRELLKN
ncbi:L-myo-inositol-1-phosphate synthase [Sulfolobus sp. A20]|uniref:inositol-3-phosphate synthase n=1 Tax=Sulfolobaceae TaxID=118883 RepID=UPI000845D4E7|nr:MULTISPECIES: inositol-3-phosphate synthase [unclassified Sulfolobus]TRM74285.1 L-myo-inositol-1-phosphate synthase [Sulfolobus sp. E5]TRM75352.1 L-myo-inositol-1-phosphate synthase [Sulfolobus sp. A20-N-F8]TRM76367.1 L-myo-inositol-1-phosphate synthase [Sulfolobus sp. B5]TRM81309.1 L-myo-inositol-1-phosphate synthase [Sulfolobus sp. D5]TRM83378.1 L-myo-inositol-1-phosphate synthase [Sulfolobus sp. A20-N-F6]TRM87319.1 L-myo-inositol-1-phosphate synthase [Sulfolobus sp. C3]TRM88696.1 L-myo